MKKKIFPTIYAVIIGAIIIASSYAVRYVQTSIDEYEASQPEHVLEDLLFLIENMDGLSTIVEYPEINTTRFDPEGVEETILSSYEKKTENVKEWTYKILSGGYSETAREYGLYGDGTLLARVTLKCNSSKPVMEILTVNDWSIDQILPYLTYKSHSLAVELPKGFSAEINGYDVNEKTEDVEIIENGENLIYRLDNLLEMPKVRAFDSHGRECTLIEQDGYFTAELEYYHLILPEYFTVYEDEIPVEGVKTDKGIEYRFASNYKSLYIVDKYGQKVTYKNGDSVASYDVSFRIPSNFIAFFQQEYMIDHLVEAEDIEIYDSLKLYAKELEDIKSNKTAEEAAAIDELVRECGKLPQIYKYTITGSICKPEVSVFDNIYQELTPEFVDNYFEITEQTVLPEVPAEILAEVNPIEYAKIWSRFMTDDLGTDKYHGVDKMRALLIPDSYLDGMAINWSKNIDITFTSSHSTYEFVEEKMTNYISYSENMFSCDIYLDKLMAVETKTFTGDVHDIMKNTAYFYKYMGEWKILALENQLR